jgi:CRISPR-associated endonuclease/helicase Cas3
MATQAPAATIVPFAEFLRLIHSPRDGDWQPYPWQQRFAERCAAPGGAPPSWVVAPTGAGKTVAVEALVWALAAQAKLPAAERTASTRIVWAIDRRILVDQVHERAEALAGHLEAALGDGPENPLHEVAARLLQLAAGGEGVDGIGEEERRERGPRPLIATRWRGGIPRDESLLSPFQPQVITSTVGQIGSRLLFRGFGVGRSSLPLSAGIAATDTTICLDEAHLAVPFRETVDAIRRRRQEEPLRTPDLHLVTLTATPSESHDPGDSIDLTEADRRRLGSRWSGAKSVELREPGGRNAQELAAATEELVRDGARVVACIANRVLTARSAHDSLRKRLGDKAEVLLLIGPQRPADREAQLELARGPLLDGRSPERPLVVVATQTIEVGLDADFDGMVTQSASASALIQRLGRLNRSGRRPGRCIVIRDPNSSLYERDEPEAWRWLCEKDSAPTNIDASVRAIAEGAQPPADRCQPLAASLTDSVVAQLAQTSTKPAQMADPDIDPLLSGIGARSLGDVRIVWRCDLRFGWEEGEAKDSDPYCKALLELAPPRAWESLTLSVGAAKSVLRGLLAGSRKLDSAARSDADVEGGGRNPDEAFVDEGRAAFAVVRGGEVLSGALRPDEAGDGAVALAEIAAGDILVVPTALGGIDSYGLAASRSGEAEDVHPDMRPSDKQVAEKDPAPIRLSWETFWQRASRSKSWRAGLPDSKEKEAAARRRWRRFARSLGTAAGISSQALPADDAIQVFLGRERPDELRDVVDRLSSSEHHWRLRRVDPPPSQSDEEGFEDDAAAQRSSWVLQPVQSARGEASKRSAPPTVESHSEAVRGRVSEYAERLNLPEAERGALELAALAHDLGKLDPRFQDFLAGGSREPGMPLLAKSSFGERNPAAASLARERSGLPYGFRHEARSAAILDSAFAAGSVPSDLGNADQPLATFFTGAHHSFGLPLWPLEWGGKPAEEFAVDLMGIRGRAGGENADGWLGGRWMQLFFDLQERYGPWTLAYLGALLVLADRTISREGR